MTTPNDHPFGAPRSGVRRWLGLAGFLLAAAAVTILVLRLRGRGAPDAMEGHDMASMSGGPSGAAGPVRLTPTDRQRIGITFAAVEMGPLVRTVRVVGLVKEDETRIRTVTARVDGFVERLDADFTGRWVGAGEALLGLYAPEVVAAQTELLLALDLERAIATEDPEGRSGAARAVASARQRLAWWLVPDDVIARVERTGQVEQVVPLRSPWDGFAVEKRVTLGQRIMAGEPLYRLADLSVVWVEGEVFEQDLPLVRLGAPVLVTLPSLPGVERRGRVAYIYPSVDATTRTARIRVELPNPGLALKPGMYGSMQFEGTVTDGLTVPRSAIISTGTRSLVFIKAPDGRLEPREVVLGASSAERMQVLSGLALGDTVVASGTFLLDAESNLGTLLGGMGDMPGMDLSAPRRPDSAPRPVPPNHDGHGGR